MSSIIKQPEDVPLGTFTVPLPKRRHIVPLLQAAWELFWYGKSSLTFKGYSLVPDLAGKWRVRLNWYDRKNADINGRLD